MEQGELLDLLRSCCMRPLTEEERDLVSRLPQISDFVELATMWVTSSGSRSEHLIEERMGAVVAGISDFNELAEMRENTSSGSRPEQLVEERMRAMISEVTADSVPEWFVALLRDPEEIPSYVRGHFEQKAQELLEDLEGSGTPA